MRSIAVATITGSDCLFMQANHPHTMLGSDCECLLVVSNALDNSQALPAGVWARTKEAASRGAEYLLLTRD